MKFELTMATEAQRLISISLAKIAASRCVRGGVSLHKNLLVATVLQKARYIFMEEAFHMVHGHYINHANGKFIQQLRHQEMLETQLRQSDKEYDDEDDDSTALDDSELDIFSSPMDSNESLNFLNDSSASCKDAGSNNNNIQSSNNNNVTCNSKTNSNKIISPSTSANDLIYLDLDVNRNDHNHHHHQYSNSINSGQKRRFVDDDEDDNDDDEDDGCFIRNATVLSIFPSKNKQMKFSCNRSEIESSPSSSSTCTSNNDKDKNNTSNEMNESNNIDNDSSSNNINSNVNHDITTDNCLSLDFLSNDLNLTSAHAASIHSPTHTSTATKTTTNVMMAPLDMTSTSALSQTSSSCSSSSANAANSPIQSSPTPQSPSSSSIDRITSLVSIFNFGNLQRSVSTPDLCSSSSNTVVENSCCNLQQRQIAMTV
jgi:hypothetical protein